MTDLCALTDGLHSTLLALHQDVDAVDVDLAFLEGLLACWAKLADAARLAGQIRDEFAEKLADAYPYKVKKNGEPSTMREKRITVMGVGTFERHRKSNRTEWDKDGLLRMVLDSRRADPETGEFAEESDLDKVLDVWTLGAPKVTAMRERGLDPDEFCKVEKGAMTLEVVTNG